jgi:hypothetical protein
MTCPHTERAASGVRGNGSREDDRRGGSINPIDSEPSTQAQASNSGPVLADIAQEINEHDKARRACEVKGIMHALRIGQLLIEAKGKSCMAAFFSG